MNEPCRSFFLKEYFPKRIIWMIAGSFGVIELYIYGYSFTSLILTILVILAATTHYRLEINASSKLYSTYILFFGFHVSKQTASGITESIFIRKINHQSDPFIYQASIKFLAGGELILSDETSKEVLFKKMRAIGQVLDLNVVDVK